MPTNSERAFDATIRHQIYLQRYSANVLRSMRALLKRSERELLERIAGAELGDAASLAATIAEVRAVDARLGRDLERLLNERMYELAGYEAEFTVRVTEELTAVKLNAVNPETVRAAVTSKPFAGPHLSWALANEHLSEYSRRRSRLVIDAASRAAVQGDSVADLMRTIRGTKAANYADGLLEVSARTAETIARTALNHIASASREEAYARNAHVLEGVQWVSVLDRRTSPICRARDGKVYPVGSGPRPPAHPNCRSSTVSIFKGEEPPEVPTYGQWLKRQPADVIDDVLGPTRAKLFLDGNLPLDRFVDESGKVYSLDTLRAKEAKAFKRADA